MAKGSMGAEMFEASCCLTTSWILRSHAQMHDDSDNSWITLKSLLLWLNNFVNSPRSLLWPVSQTALISSLVNVDLWFWFSSSAFTCSARSLLHCLLHLLMSSAWVTSWYVCRSIYSIIFTLRMGLRAHFLFTSLPKQFRLVSWL